MPILDVLQSLKKAGIVGDCNLELYKKWQRKSTII